MKTKTPVILSAVITFSLRKRSCGHSGGSCGFSSVVASEIESSFAGFAVGS